MRVGIETLHDSPNYGAVLQAYALRKHLESIGHSAFVIDRRRNVDLSLRTPPSLRTMVRLLGLHSVDAHNGARAYASRCTRTEEFLRTRVGLSPYRFHNWRDAPQDMGVDVIVVGSDQVWNANNHDPEDYLLSGVRDCPPGVAYAASIGMPTIPAELTTVYRAGFSRFSSIAVREHEAVDLLASMGFDAVQVVDPVLLAEGVVWDDLLIGSKERSGNTFAYFLAEDFESMLPILAQEVKRTGRRVELFVDWFVRRAPHGIVSYLKNRTFERRWRNCGVDLRLDAGPLEFVRSLAAADSVLSNSYHALMFSIVFGKKIRIVRPTHPVRRQMNSRLDEFESLLASGKLVYDDLRSALAEGALSDFATFRMEALQARIAFSRNWLSSALEACH